MEFINEDKNFEECIKNVCIYCINLEKYQPLKEKYPKIHNDIYNKRENIINFINKFSSEDIKAFPLTKLITYQEYIDKYKERHIKIAEFYGDFNPQIYQKSMNNMATLIDEESEKNELKKKDKNELLRAFSEFDIIKDNNISESNSNRSSICINQETQLENNNILNKDIEELDKLLIKEYTKNTFYGDLNKWLMNSKINSYESIAYFTARLMYSLNSYASKNKLFFETKKVLYRGIKIPYSCLLPYERAKGKIIILSGFTSTSENKGKALKFSGRNKSKELYKVRQCFSVLYIIKNKWKKNWVSSGINIQNESSYKEEEILYQPFSFYYVEDVKINLKKYTADIYLKTIGKKEILEEKIKEGKEIFFNKIENLIELKKEE